VETNNHKSHFILDLKPFVCDLCPKRCAWLFQIRKHVEIHKKEKNFKCEACPKSFASKFELFEHLKRSAGVKLKCDLCDAEFPSNASLRQHKNFVHSNLSLKCDKCEYVAKNLQLLKIHQHVHQELTDADAVECEKCRKKCPSKLSLAKHISQVHSELRFKCDEFNCSYVAKTITLLKDHQGTHDKFFRCDICAKTFAKKQQLTEHIEIKHEGSDRFKCHICNKRLTTKQSLHKHLQTHEEVISKEDGIEKASTQCSW